MLNHLRLLPLCFVILCFATVAYADEEPTRDHVLLITIDDLNDWIGCLTDQDAPGKDGHLTGEGHPQASTPNMDRLAERGVLFTNAHCQAPICRPSRTSFMSGLRPTTSGVYANKSAYDAKGKVTPGKELPWMTKRFGNAGYDVFVTGKILHGSNNKVLGGIPSFKTSQGPYPKKKMGVPAEITKAGVWDLGAWPEEEKYTDWRIAQWTIGNINKPVKPDSKPRFMALGFYNPHVPLFAPPKWFDAAPSTKPPSARWPAAPAWISKWRPRRSKARTESTAGPRRPRPTRSTPCSSTCSISTAGPGWSRSTRRVFR